MPRTRSEATCCVCLGEYPSYLSTNPDTIKLSKLDGNNLTLLDKLKVAIPEIKWLSNYRICRTCTNLLNIVYQFRETCLKSDAIRGVKQITPKKEKKEKHSKKEKEVKNEKTREKTDQTEKENTKEYIFNEAIDIKDEQDKNSPNEIVDDIKPDEAPLPTELQGDETFVKSYSSDDSDLEDTDNLVHDPDFTEFGDQVEVIIETENDKDNVKIKEPRDKEKLNLKRIKRQRKVWRFECEHCNEKFTSSTKLVDHCVTEHSIAVKDVRPFACERCPRRFGNSSNLLQHIKYHDAVRSNVCTYCGKGFITKTDLNIHEKQHLNKREYKCDDCKKSFNTHKDLRSHKLVVHTDSSEWKYLCVYCDKRFPIKSNFDCHMRRHTGDKKFHCHLCEKRFTDKCVLQRHMRTHSNVRDFKCSSCNKEYKDKRVMQVHMAKVHGIGVGDIKLPTKERKYICHICPKAYFAKNKLTRHLYTHTGEKPFFCKICDRKFNDRSYVKQHMMKAHNLDMESIGEIGVIADDA